MKRRRSQTALLGNEHLSQRYWLFQAMTISTFPCLLLHKHTLTGTHVLRTAAWGKGRPANYGGCSTYPSTNLTKQATVAATDVVVPGIVQRRQQVERSLCVLEQSWNRSPAFMNPHSNCGGSSSCTAALLELLLLRDRGARRNLWARCRWIATLPALPSHS